MQVEKLYQCMKLYNVVLMNWFRFAIVPPMCSISVCIIASLYVTCRPSGLPIIIYCVFPMVAMVALFVVFRMCFNAVVAKMTGDEVLGNVQLRTARFYYRPGPAERKELMRRAKALQPVRVAIGEFAEITMEVYVSIVDEILNQLLFLLSL